MNKLFNTMPAVSATISLAALAHNLKIIKNCAPESHIMAMIKADAYGHGALPIAKTLINNGASALGVARLSEGMALRDAGITQAIVLLEGVWSIEELTLAQQCTLQVVIHHPQQVALIELFVQQQIIEEQQSALNLWLKFDTGMHRLGLTAEQLIQAKQRIEHSIAQSKKLSSSVGLLTHFACADEENNPFTAQQIAQFSQYAAQFSRRSMANSAAIFSFPESHADWNRPGIALYGVSPLAHKSAKDLGLKPVMTLSSNIIAVRHHKAGEPVGYGCSWVSNKDTVLGVVAIGYGDGYPRHAPSGTPVLINGEHYPLVGRVSMDMVVVDLGLNSPVDIGDKVVLWGDGLPVETIAEAAGTIGYELLCGVTSRVSFLYQ